MNNAYEVIGSFSYVNTKGTSWLQDASGADTNRIVRPKPVRIAHVANFLATDAEDAIAKFKRDVDDFANTHHYSNGGDRFTTELVVTTATIESVALLGVDVNE